MRTILRSGVLLLAAWLLFTACSSGLSITKRRYTKGYYVHSGSKAGNAGAFAANYRTPPLNQDLRSDLLRHQPGGGSATGRSMVASNEPKRTPAGIEIPTASGFTTEMLVQDPIKTFRQLKRQIAENPASEEALSLIWILILVLLAAYIAGLLLDSFGLGWVIHLLLVVILILLILWLLRIV